MLYALNHLPSVRNVVVCGHTDYGAMAALADFAHGELEPELEWWSAQVEPMLNRALSMDDEPVLVQALVEANIQFQVEGLCDYEVVRKDCAKGLEPSTACSTTLRMVAYVN